MLVQLAAVTPRLPEPPLAVESDTSRAHARSSVRQLVDAGLATPGTSVLEFASHHGGSWLEHLTAAGCDPLPGGESRAQLVVDVHALAHEVALGEALRERAERLTPDGRLILEFHHLLPLFLGGQFDTVRHGHWSYLSLGALCRLARLHGLEVVSADTVEVFGGSLRVVLAPASAHCRADGTVGQVLDAERQAGIHDGSRLARLQRDAEQAAEALRAYLSAVRGEGRSVVGYGAPSKAAVLLGVSGVGTELLPFTVDAAPGKHGRLVPGCGIPIRPVEDLRRARPDVVLIVTWDIWEEVVAHLERDGGWGAEYVVPLPRPHTVR